MGKTETELNRQSAFSRAVHSIRTRCSLATALLLLFALAAFYAGGRVVLVHLIRDAEARVKEVGLDLSRVAYRSADRARARMVALREEIRARIASGDLLDSTPAVVRDAGDFSLVLRLASEGTFACGVCRGAEGRVADVRAEDVEPYAETLMVWCKRMASGQCGRSLPIGIMRLCGAHHYVTLVRDGGAFDLVGLPFGAVDLTGEMNEHLSGMEVRVTNRRADLRPAGKSRGCERTDRRNHFGIAPLFSEAANFYTGGFWDLNVNPFEAVFAVRDIAGNAVSMVAVSLPKTLSSVTTAAISRLTFFIAVVGILLILPIFWVQARLLLNPLSRMTREIAELGRHNADIDCPRLEWTGKDEFAQLAESVNRMIETIAAKTVSLANVEASHQALIDGVPDALAVFDPQGRLVSITKQPEGVAQLPGFFPGEPPAAAVFGDEPVRDFATALEEVFRTGEIRKARLKVQRPIGVPKSVPTRHFEVRLTRLSERFALAIVRDVSAEVAEHKLRLAAEQRALDASKRESLTVLAAGIAHDMNNVLSIVLNAAEARDADPSGDSLRALTTIRDAVRKGSSMMRELRTFAGENKMTLMRAKPKLVLEDVRPLASRVVGKNVILTIESRDDVPDVDVDPGQFWKVFFNIIKNASEAIGSRPGHITLDAIPFEMTEGDASGFISEHPLVAGPGVLFRIADDGPGIPPNMLGRIFDPYASSKALGRGLGLATVRTIVEAHGGGIRVRSEPDRGTTFLLFLPASKMPAPAETDVTNVEQPALSGDVLVVDNDEAILKTTSILLKALKMTPHVAHDRREALATVRRHADRMRAIILDAHLGGIDTVRLLDAFRIGAPHVPVIVSSGSSKDEIAKMFGIHRYDDFLAKPYTIAELKASLSRPVPPREG